MGSDRSCAHAGPMSEISSSATSMGPTRREVLRMMAGSATVALGASALASGGTSTSAADRDEPAATAALDGELRLDEATRAAAANDFGHLVRRTPHGVLVPGCDP